MALIQNIEENDMNLLYDHEKKFENQNLQIIQEEDQNYNDDHKNSHDDPTNLNELNHYNQKNDEHEYDENDENEFHEDGNDEDEDEEEDEEPIPSKHKNITDDDHKQKADDTGSVSSYVGSDLTPDEVLKKKKTLLYKLKRFQKKGFTLSRPYNLNSNLIDMKAEVDSIRREANLGATVATMKKGLTISTYLLEMLNNQFDPINAKLDGWSNQVSEDVQHGDYDEVCEELYDKYSHRLEMPPEMKLMSMLATSALQYHVAQIVVHRTLDNNQTDKILKQNPQIKKDIIQAANESNVMNNINKQQKKMNDPSDIDDILQELQIEDENSKILSTNF